MRYREADVARLRTVPFAGRRNKVDPSAMAAPPGNDRTIGAFLQSLPDVLAARGLRAVISHVAEAARSRKGGDVPLWAVARSFAWRI